MPDTRYGRSLGDPDFAHPAFAEQWWTVEGGFVLLQPENPHESRDLRFAVTAGDDDAGVALTEEERVRLARWLLEQTCTPAEWRFVRAAVDLVASRVRPDDGPESEEPF